MSWTPAACIGWHSASEKYNWWLNELDSLGTSTLEKNGLNNRKEASDGSC